MTGADIAATPAQPRKRLFRKYALLFGSLVAAALIASGAIEVYFSYRETKAALLQIQREKAEAAAAVIEQFVKEVEAQIGWTTHAAFAPGAESLAQRRVDYLRLLRQAPAITEIGYLDAAGKEQVLVSRLAMDVVGSNKDYSVDPKFRDARAQARYLSPVYFRKESEPYMTLGLAGRGRDRGVTVAEVNLKFIWDLVSRIKVGRQGHAFVVDATGLLIAHPDISLVLRKTDLSPLAHVRIAREPTPVGQPATIGTIATDLAGREVLSSYAAISPVGWTVFVESPLTEAFAPLYDSLVRTGILLVAGIALSVLAGLLLARRMVGPIQALTTGAARIGSGELGQRIDIKTGDELEALADQFNRMGSRLQESYATLERRVEDRTRALSESLEQQTATSEVLRAIASSPGEAERVLDTITRTALRMFAGTTATIMSAEGQSFREVAAAGDNVREVVEALSGLPIDRGLPAGRATLDKRTVHVEDIEQQGHEFPLAPYTRERLGARAILSTPLMREGEALGAMTITRSEARPFTAKEIELLESFAAQAVIAIENTRLLTELRDTLAQQTATSEVLQVISSSPGELEPVFQAMLANSQRICDAKLGILFRYYDGTFHVAASLDAPPAFTELLQRGPIHAGPRTGLGRLAASHQTVHIDDLVADPAYAEGDPLRIASVELGGVRTWLGVPMLKEDELIGAIVIYRKEVLPFAEKQIALVESFAAQAVIAIENARLLSELQDRTRELARSVEELRALGAVGQAVSSTLDLQKVLDTIAEKAVALTGTDACAIHAYDDASETFGLQAAYRMDPTITERLKRTPVRLGQGAIGQAALRRNAVQFPDMSAAPDYPMRDAVVRSGYNALLAVPLAREDEIIGAIVVMRRAAGEFAAPIVSLLQTFASQSALAIQNASLFREIEDKSHQLEIASEHKSQFLANMSHELRTPLNAILGYTELIVDDVYGPVGDKIRGVLERVQTNGRHLLGLINDVLDLSKIEAGQLTLSLADYSIGDVVNTVMIATESLATEKKLAVKIAVPKTLPHGQGDERRLTQVLLNLVGNAIKFTDAGEVGVAVTADNGAFELAVSDTGPGIPETERERIFEEFHQVDSSSTRKKGGTGLGLSIARKIVELHGGRIWVESEVGRGSTFRITLPVKVGAARVSETTGAG